MQPLNLDTAGISHSPQTNWPTCSDQQPLQWLHYRKDPNTQIIPTYLALQLLKFKGVFFPSHLPLFICGAHISTLQQVRKFVYLFCVSVPLLLVCQFKFLVDLFKKNSRSKSYPIIFYFFRQTTLFGNGKCVCVIGFVSLNFISVLIPHQAVAVMHHVVWFPTKNRMKKQNAELSTKAKGRFTVIHFQLYLNNNCMLKPDYLKKKTIINRLRLLEKSKCRIIRTREPENDCFTLVNFSVCRRFRF